MTELEWLKQESGLDDNELAAMEAVAGRGKFVAMLQKIIATNEQSTKAKTEAEQARLDLEKRYNEEFIPEMRKVTQDALSAQSRAAAAEAALKQAREYGIVPPETPNTPAPEVRAPGSPDPNALNQQFQEWSARQSNAIKSVNKLNAEHFRLFKEPLGNLDELEEMVRREHTLGHKDFTLDRAWETKYNVPAKRQEIQQAEQQKVIDERVQAAIKEERQKFGAHPGLVSGQPSRFSTYKPSDARQGAEPWKTAPGMSKAANQPWRDKAVQKITQGAA